MAHIGKPVIGGAGQGGREGRLGRRGPRRLTGRERGEVYRQHVSYSILECEPATAGLWQHAQAVQYPWIAQVRRGAGIKGGGRVCRGHARDGAERTLKVDLTDAHQARVEQIGIVRCGLGDIQAVIEPGELYGKRFFQAIAHVFPGERHVPVAEPFHQLHQGHDDLLFVQGGACRGDVRDRGLDLAPDVRRCVFVELL